MSSDVANCSFSQPSCILSHGFSGPCCGCIVPEPFLSAVAVLLGKVVPTYKGSILVCTEAHEPLKVAKEC